MRISQVGFSTFQILGAGIMVASTSNTMASGFALIEQSASQQGNAYAGAAAFAGIEIVDETGGRARVCVAG